MKGGRSKETMEKLIEYFNIQTVFTVVIGLWVIFMAGKEILEHFDWWKNRADKFNKKKSDEKQEKIDFEQKVCDIACTSEKHTETLAQIGEALDGINKRLDDMENERKEDIIANGRATMYHLYEEMKDKEALTTSDYETFNAIATRYLEAGGNAVFKDKIIPEIYAKPVDND